MRPRSAPTTEPVIAAATEQQEKHKDDQEKFHSVLHDKNCGTVQRKWVWSNAGHSLGIYLYTIHAPLLADNVPIPQRHFDGDGDGDRPCRLRWDCRA